MRGINAGEPPPEPELCGLKLAQFAAVEVALAEGFALDDILLCEGIHPSVWAAAKPAWLARLALRAPSRDAALETSLFADYKALAFEAEDRLVRRVEPLDDDLMAWLCFLNAWSSHSAPFELLKNIGLSMNDISRLSRRWSTRIGSDNALRNRAAELAKKPKTEKIPPLLIEPAKLLPSPFAPPASRAPERAAPPSADTPPAEIADMLGLTYPAVAIGRGPALPFGPPDAFAARRLPPSPRAPIEVTGTSPYIELRRAPPLPFEGAEPPPLLTKKNQRDIDETSPFVRILAAPVLPFEQGPASSEPESSGVIDNPSRLTLEQHASITLELVLYPAREGEVLARYRLTRPELDRINADYKRRFAADTAIHARWHEAYRTYYAWLASALVAR